ncbi:MFS transporter [Leifsonia sp. SIMBA_070]|uniref:MFS transporter n=1 Tax=Leifsonia sp. SIMBA_070 TaxID=3085810 RepID=UPI00397B5ECF
MTHLSPGPTAADSGDAQRRRGPAFAVCIAVGALTILDLSGVNVALPSIQRSLHADSTQLQLIVAGYALAFGLSLIPSGRLGDTRSRRAMFVIGLIGFSVASALCALAPGIVWLTVTRFLQGAAAGVQMPQVLGMIQQLYRGEERGRAFGVFGAMVGIATAIGPTLAGSLIALGGPTDGWRLLFWFNVPCGAIALFFALRFLPRDQHRGEGGTELDPVGLGLLAVAIIGLMLPFLLTTGSSTDDPLRWLWLIAFAVAGVAFLFWERAYRKRGLSPIVHLELFGTASYRNGILIATVYFAGLPASFLVTTLFLQEGLHAQPLAAGLVSVPFALGAAVSAFIGGRLVQRFGRALVVVGLIVVIVGIGALLASATLAPPSAAEWFMAGSTLIGGLGGGLVISPNQTLTLSEVPPEEGSAAGSIAQLGQRIGTAVGVALVTAVFFATVPGGGSHPVSEYHAAVRGGYLVTLALLAVALVVGLVDLRERHRAGKRGV